MQKSDRKQLKEKHRRENDGGNGSSYDPSSSYRYDMNDYDVESNRDGGLVDPIGVLNPNNAIGTNQKTDDDEGEGYIEELLNQQRKRNNERIGICTEFLADLSFFFGSTMYLWLVISQAKDFLISRSSANEGSNGDDTIQFADSTWSRSNNSAYFLEDQVIFKQITLHVLYGFSAGMLMFAAGFLRFFTTARNASDKIPCAIMCLAAVFAMVSSALVRTYPFWSDCLYSVSVHLFAFQATILLLWRSTSTRGMVGMSCIRLLGDCLYFMATVGAIAVSYFYLFDATDWLPFEYEYLEVGSYVVWWWASVVYLVQTMCLLVCHRNRDKEKDGCCCRRGALYYDEDSYGQGIPKSLRQKDTLSTCEDDDREEASAYQRKTSNRKAAPRDEEQSVMSLWTAGPGPANREHIARSSLDDIFGRG
eukprot:jgi/Psemu1/284502/fgenesh1_pg.56_\